MHLSLLCIAALALVGLSACDDDDDDSAKLAKAMDSGFDASTGGHAAPKPDLDGGVHSPSDAAIDAAKPHDAGECMIDSGDPTRRLEQRCAGGRCPATVDAIADFLSNTDDDAGCHTSSYECCGIVTVNQDCLIHWGGWTFDRKTGVLIGAASHGDVLRACQPDPESGVYVRDCADALAKGLCEMDGG